MGAPANIETTIPNLRIGSFTPEDEEKLVKTQKITVVYAV
jgi:hypothetical protein